MADVTHMKIDEMEAIDGVFEGIRFHKAAAGLEVTSFGISIVDLAPGADRTTPSTTIRPEGIGGEMFAKRPQQLGQEEVYIALSGSGTLEADGEQLPARRRPHRPRRPRGEAQGHPRPRGHPPAGDRRHAGRGLRDGRRAVTPPRSS